MLRDCLVFKSRQICSLENFMKILKHFDCYTYLLFISTKVLYCRPIPLKKYAGTYTDTIFICQVHMHADTRFIMSVPRCGKLSVGCQPIRIRENNTINNYNKQLLNEVE